MPNEPQNLADVFLPTWELAKYKEFDNARSFAIAHGWRANPQKVQIRFDWGWYYVELYEECDCPNIIQPF